MHAIFGYGIGIADEMRVRAAEHVLYLVPQKAGLAPRPHSHRAVISERNTFFQIIHAYVCQQMSLNVSENGIEQHSFQRAQRRAVLVSKAELGAIHKLARQFNRQVWRRTGKKYAELTTIERAQLDLSRSEFVKKAQAIKNKFEKPANRTVEKKSSRILKNAARLQGVVHHIPAAGQSWIDAQPKIKARRLKPYNYL